ncbi:MAG TPA: TIR domain-containing protein, partial [Pyrinomonadaceae bacterium]|nr:TIR domain-containing protein [Pyrinomonadaceae bacterium]
MFKNFKFDVFISHSSKDKPAVRELAERLAADGLRIWLDEWEIKPGDMIGLKVNEGLEQSRTLVLVMSANASESEWVTFESQTIQFTDPTNQRRRFIPLRLDDAEIKGALKQFAYVDWRQRDVEQYTKLLAACRPQNPADALTVEQKGAPNLARMLAGHVGVVERVALTPDGLRAVSGSADKTVKVWEVETGKCLATLEGHAGVVYGVAITEDGKVAVSGAVDKTVKVWEVETGKCLATLEGHTDMVLGVSVTADGRLAVSSSRDATLRVWDVEKGKCLTTLEGHTGSVWGVAVTPDGRRAVSGAEDKTVRVWNIETGECLTTLKGHSGSVGGVAITPDGRQVVSGAEDKTVRVWDIETGECLGVLEGHTKTVRGVAVTADGRRAASCSDDTTVRVWDVAARRCVATLEGHLRTVFGVAIAGNGLLVVSGSWDRTLWVWELLSSSEKASENSIATRKRDAVPLLKPIIGPETTKPTLEPKTARSMTLGPILKPIIGPETARYTNAKVLLVGDSGVGKTGLAYRLTEDRFEHTMSTDGVWATQLRLPHESGSKEIEREIWLWDFAGQADYRLIHQLFMDETALAVLVFNPQSENPFEGLGQWDRDLQRAARRPFKKILVAGRCDRGGLMISRGNIEDFCQKRDFNRYLETSAYTGDGCDALRNAIIRDIPWDDIPWTASPRIFKLLKEEIVKLKDEGKVLLRISELKQQLEVRLSGEAFTLEQLRAVIGLLAGPGIVWQLEFGNFILLQPGHINAYAAAVI